MSDYITNAFNKSVIKCILFEFTIDRRASNAKFINNAGNRNTAVFDGFLQDFALMWHKVLV